MATMRTAPSDRDAKVARLFEAGATDEEMAIALGVTEGTVRRDRHYLGLLRRPTPAAHVPDDVLRELVAGGLDNGQIADRSGLTRRSVQQRLHRLGIASVPVQGLGQPRAGEE